MHQASAPTARARSTRFRIVSISGMVIGTVASLMAFASALVGRFAIEVAASSAADVLARMI